MNLYMSFLILFWKNISEKIGKQLFLINIKWILKCFSRKNKLHI